MRKSILFFTALNMIVIARSQSWLIDGNSGTNPKVHFVGTKDDTPLLFRINNKFAGEIDSVFGQTLFGFRAGGQITSGTGNAAMGYKSLFSNTSGNSNTSVGQNTLFSNTTGFNNSAFGVNALYSNINGRDNTAIGDFAMYYNSGGYFNTAIGSYALYNSNASFNTAVGRSALVYNTTGYGNTATGYQTLANNTTGFYNTATGHEALYVNTTGYYNTATGTYALKFNNTGSFNTAMGYSCMSANAGGSNNTATGFGALSATNNSQNNTAIGYLAGTNYNMGWNNTILGANCDVTGADYYNCIAIGQVVTCTGSSQARIGNSFTVSIGGYTNWTNISDGRYKKDVNENVKGIDFIMKLRPVTYHLDVSGISKKLGEGRDKEMDATSKQAIAEKEKTLFSGFVAQEVEQAAKTAGYDFSGVDKPQNETGLYGLRYAEFVVPLVKAMQEQQKLIQDLQSEVELLKARADATVLMRENAMADRISAYPNPANNDIMVTVSTQKTGNGSIQLFDSAGKLVKQMNISIHQGANTIHVPLPGLAAGYYNMKLDWGQNMHKTVSIVKQ